VEEKERPYIGYKIDTKHTYKVYVNESNGKKFYKVQIKKKNYDNTEISFYKQLRFVQCNPPENGEIIKIIYGFEDLYVNNKDSYNPISVIVIMEYEKVDNPVVNQEKAYDKFQQNLKENEMEESHYEISDEQLPF
jgi:hypothetical protein